MPFTGQRVARCRRACACDMPSTSWSTDAPPPAELNTTALASMLEATFVPAVMSLARGDVTETKLFVATAYTAHAARTSLDSLEDALGSCTTMSAGRPLAPEEISLRSTWLLLCYLTLEMHSAHGLATGDADAPLVPPSLRTRYEGVIAAMLKAKRAATPLSQVKLDEVAGEALLTNLPPLDKLILQQSLRIVYLAVDVLTDVELAGERADAKSTSGKSSQRVSPPPPEARVPRPFIPGTS